MTNFQYIPHRDTKNFSKMVLDYVEEAEDLRDFYTFQWDSQTIPKVIKAVEQQSFDRVNLVATLLQQYEGFEQSEATTNNMLALESKNTFTITTAHQLNLFTGPLYFIFKIAAAIKTAQQLKKQYPQYNFVPVYWMGSEDHDFAEINHTWVYGQGITWEHPNPSGGVGRLVTTGMQETLATLSEILGDRTGAKELISLLEKAYLGQDNLVKASRYLVNELFGQYGLVIIDQDDKAFKKTFKPIIKRELREKISHSSIQNTNQELEAKDYHQQAFTRPINFFYLKDAIRERIEWNAEKQVYEVLQTDITFTETSLLAEVEQYPERFSPNVLLRPIYQQYILPNLAYIGGGGELAYWLQLKQVFKQLEVVEPILMLRNSVLIVDQKTADKITGFDWTIVDFFEDIEIMVKTYVKRETEEELNLAAEKQKMTGIFEEVLIKAKSIDKTLESSVLGEQRKLEKSFSNLEQKLLRAEKRKHEQAIKQIRKIKATLFPKGKLQERHDNFIPFYLKYGNDFIAHLIEGLEPFKKQFAIWMVENT